MGRAECNSAILTEGAECNSAVRAERAMADRRKHRGWYSRGYLPHLDVAGLVQHVTFHLADSLPRSALEQMQASVAEIPEDRQALERRER
ncbi:MAG: hypothetical protein N838_05870 [Thiohalocapsa sp. PB-PSB1]|nr:MAG: hypothetical protein N838_05870 [Thiohalocapsa sp. PB-PSB1]